VVVLATGFQVDRFLRPIEVIGRGGVRLNDFWEKRPLAYLSIAIPGFPNLFMLNGPNGPVGNFSLIEVAEIQFEYIRQLIEWFRSGRAREIGVSAAATEELEAERVEAARSTIWSSGCQSWYLDDRGIPMTWPWTFERFRAEMSGPKPEAYELVS
jgi:cation diffusion facilitator CzcD-associated flavoprotein CzcO